MAPWTWKWFMISSESMRLILTRQRRQSTQTPKGNGTLDMEMVHDIFRIYEVDLDEAASSKYADAEGLVTKAEFVRLGQDYKLLDFTGGGIGKPPSTPRKKS